MSEHIIGIESGADGRLFNDIANMYGEVRSIGGEIVRCRDCRHMFDWAYDVPMCKLWAFNDPDDSNASSGNALYPTVELDGYCWRGERR